ncbi:hypothetical protein JOQ06_021766, partial [Pogonophryne albipinna]
EEKARLDREESESQFERDESERDESESQESESQFERDESESQAEIYSKPNHPDPRGLALRGHDRDEGNLWQLLRLRSGDDDVLKRWLNFVGLYEVSSTTGKNLAKVATDVLLRLNLPLSCLRGQTYDGAANMSGESKGALYFGRGLVWLYLQDNPLEELKGKLHFQRILKIQAINQSKKHRKAASHILQVVEHDGLLDHNCHVEDLLRKGIPFTFVAYQ